MPTMKDCILEQADVLRRVAEEMPAECARTLAVTGRDFDRVLLVGSGSSLNAAFAARHAFERFMRADVQVITPFDFLHYYPHKLLDGRTLVLGISQTARSTGTIDSIGICKEKGAMTVFVTAEADAPGAHCAHVMFDTHTGLELVGAKTKGYTSTIVALYWLAAALGGADAAFDGLADYVEEILRRTEKAMPAMVEALLPAKSATVVSYGPAMGIAREAALKIKETVRIPVEVYDVEEYMHGPYHCLAADSWLIFLLPEGAGQERAGRLIRFAEKITGHILIVTNEKFAANGFDGLVLPLPDRAEEFSASVGYVIPMQWLANDATLAKGRRPEASAYPNFHKELGSKFMPKVNYYAGLLD